MKTVKQSVEIMDLIDGESILKKIEVCGRICYKSKVKDFETTKNFIKSLIKAGHESVLEHVSITVKFITDRAIANEIVRHRIASYSQESSRYCDYSNEIEFIEPSFKNEVSDIWKKTCEDIEKSYDCIARNEGIGIARSILPLSTKTELIMTANLREWRHFLKLRCSSKAHPQMRELTYQLKDKLQIIPIIFDDLGKEDIDE